MPPKYSGPNWFYTSDLKDMKQIKDSNLPKAIMDASNWWKLALHKEVSDKVSIRAFLIAVDNFSGISDGKSPDVLPENQFEMPVTLMEGHAYKDDERSVHLKHWMMHQVRNLPPFLPPMYDGSPRVFVCTRSVSM